MTKRKKPAETQPDSPIRSAYATPRLESFGSLAGSAYSTPRLQTFGTFSELTRRVGTTSIWADKSGGGTNKTM